MSQWQERFAGQYKRYVNSLLQPVGPGGLSPLDSEFNELQQVDFEMMDQEGMFATGLEPANSDRNRNEQVLPNEETMIKLSNLGPNDNTYINANYVDGQSLFEIPFNYIGAQAPLPNTAGDFWRMIAEFQVSYIVMLTTEKNSAVYWPQRVETIINPVRSYSVRLVKATQTDDVITRHLVLTNLDTRMTREITMFQYVAWPDEGVPRDTLGLMSVILTLGKLPNSTHHPILVHCGAGVGRTGVFIALHVCLALFAMQKEINVKKVVQLLKYQRTGMVKTKVQYQYLVCALNREFQRMVVKHKRSAEVSRRPSPPLAPQPAPLEHRPPSPTHHRPPTPPHHQPPPPIDYHDPPPPPPSGPIQPVYNPSPQEYTGVNPWPSSAIDPITQPGTKLMVPPAVDPSGYQPLPPPLPPADPYPYHPPPPHTTQNGVSGVPVYPSYPSEVPNPPPVPRAMPPQEDLKNVYGVFPAERVVMGAGAAPAPPRPDEGNGFEKRLHDMVYGTGAVGTLTAPGTPRRPRQDELSVLGTNKSPVKRYLPPGNPTPGTGFSHTRASPPPPAVGTAGALTGLSHATGGPPIPDQRQSLVHHVDQSKVAGQRENVLNILQRLTEHTQKHRSQPPLPKAGTGTGTHGVRSASVSPIRHPAQGGRISPAPSGPDEYGYGLGGRINPHAHEPVRAGGGGNAYLAAPSRHQSPPGSPKEGVGKYASDFEKSLFDT